MEETLLMLIYSAGLRVGEAIRLKASDILSDRGQIRVRSGKGKKNQYTVLAGQVLDVLRRYYRRRQPEGRLFPGRNPGEHMSERTARRIFNQTKKRAGINAQATLHTLRHSFATHLYKDGVDVRYIQELMGHACIETTLRYVHVGRRAAERVRSPLEG